MSSEERSIIGTYRGYFTYTSEKGAPPHQFEFEINDLKGEDFHGVGTDGIGDFVVTGTYKMDRLTFKKIYSRRSLIEVSYVGDFSIDGQKVTGTWWLPDRDGSWEARLTFVKKTKSAGLAPEKPVPAPEVQMQTSAPPPPPEPTDAAVLSNPAPEPATASSSSDAGPRCSNCGAARGDFNFCIHCGHAFDLT